MIPNKTARHLKRCRTDMERTPVTIRGLLLSEKEAKTDAKGREALEEENLE